MTSLLAVTDAELMLQVRAGDDSSFSLLLTRYRVPIIRYLYRIVENPAIAEELAQDVFLRVYRARERYQVKAKFSTWLFRIATHVAFNWKRDARKEKGIEPLEGLDPDKMLRQIPDVTPNVEQVLMREVKAEAIRKAIAALPEKQRAAVLLHKYHGLDYRQMAETLGCSQPAVKSMLFRAYERLRMALAAEFSPELSGCKDDFTQTLPPHQSVAVSYRVQ
jgi:RNA polymerase sigma-70 factor, ECF subfamily